MTSYGEFDRLTEQHLKELRREAAAVRLAAQARTGRSRWTGARLTLGLTSAGALAAGIALLSGAVR